MGDAKDAPVILKLYDLMVWTLNHTARFPRHHRYSLARIIHRSGLSRSCEGFCEGIYG